MHAEVESPVLSTDPVLSIRNVSKRYAGGFEALKDVSLDIRRGEIFALLGPNGAGKTSLIGIVCGLVTPSGGSVTIDGHDIGRDYRAARARIGLVPQELATDMFERVWDTVSFSRGLFGKPRDPAVIERVLRDLSLFDKRNATVAELSGGMKRRVLIAKALAHEPDILFLDEPTAGVDVSLRRDMWEMVRGLRARGTTVILTTHYIEEAEEMADRVGVINRGELLLVEDKRALMAKLGKSRLIVHLKTPLTAPSARIAELFAIEADGETLVHTADGAEPDISALLRMLDEEGVAFRTIETSRSTLEDIFIELVEAKR